MLRGVVGIVVCIRLSQHLSQKTPLSSYRVFYRKTYKIQRIPPSRLLCLRPITKPHTTLLSTRPAQFDVQK